MEYVINPMFFYWMQVCSGLQVLFLLCGAIIVTGGICLFIALLLDSGCLEEPKEKRLKRIRNASTSVGLALLLIGIFMPTRSTLLEMLVTQSITAENAELTLDAIKPIVDYIVSAIAELR